MKGKWGIGLIQIGEHFMGEEWKCKRNGRTRDGKEQSTIITAPKSRRKVRSMVARHFSFRATSD